MASSGFSSSWLEDMQQKEAEKQAPWDMLEPVPVHKQLWQSLWGSSSEKSSDDGTDPESQGFLSSGLSSASDAFWNTANQAKTSAQDISGLGGGPPELFGLSYATRFKGFVATVVLASFFMFMAFFIGLPVIVLRPQKFALCFTMGSLLFMSSFALLRGPTAHIKGMLTMDRLPFTVSYLTSMGATLWASLVARSYILAVLASSLQMLALGYYMLSFIPGGTAGFRVFVAMFIKTMRLAATATYTLFKGCLKLVSS